MAGTAQGVQTQDIIKISATSGLTPAPHARDHKVDSLLNGKGPIRVLFLTQNTYYFAGVIITSAWLPAATICFK